MARVAIIVLNWNGREDSLACLESLARVKEPEHEILLVDNGSTDNSAAAIRACFPQVTVIENQENLGFVGGNNVGLRYALESQADFMLLLNNDTEVHPTFLAELVQVAESDPLIGVVGPMIYYHQEPGTIWSAGGEIDWKHGSTRMLGLDEKDRGQFGHRPREVDFVTGCAMLLRRELLDRVGLLDERFFAYYEEVEWCVRIRRAGFRIVHVAQARLWHKITPEGREASPVVHYYMTRNRLLFLKVTRAALRAWLHTLFAEYLRTLVSWTIKPKWRNKRAQRRMMIKAIWDAGRGRWGKRIRAEGL